MFYYILNENKEIALYDTDKQRLADTLLFKPNGIEATAEDIKETEDEIVVLNDGSIHFKSEVEKQYEDERTAKLFESLRAKRDELIAKTDYLVLPDYPLSEENKSKVLAYRQALRDLPEQADAPWDGGNEETPFPKLELD